MSSRVDIWKYSILEEANRQSLEREQAEADFRRCLRMYKFGDVAARVDRMFCLMGCKVTHHGGSK